MKLRKKPLMIIIVLAVVLVGGLVFANLPQRQQKTNSTQSYASQDPMLDSLAPLEQSATSPSASTAPGPGSSAAHSTANNGKVPVIAKGTFNPTAIALSAPEITNPSRGQYRWMDQTSKPAGWPVRDVYYRDHIQWGKDVEKTRGVYDFSAIDKGIKEARSRGGRLHFRIMAYCPGCGDNIAPSYIPKQANGIPDWNSETFLAAWDKLAAAVGKKYNKNPGVGFVDVGGYGPWGEWYESPEYGANISTANGTRMIRAMVNAFPNKYVLIPLMDKFPRIGAQMSPRVGLRFDCVGGMDANISQAPELKDVWKRAPLVGEWCPTDKTNAAQGLANVKTLHLSMLSSGNMPAAVSQNGTDFITANKIAGFRLALKNLTVSPTPKGATVQTTWSNQGVAPTYDQWNVELRLLNSAGKIVARHKLSDNLTAVLPGTKTFTSTISLPSTASGQLTAAIAVVDPARYLSPMNLAITGRSNDGSYKLGPVSLT